MRHARFAAIVVVVLIASSCTKSFSVPSIALGPPPAVASNLGTAAIVLTPSAILDEYVTTIGANSYVYRGVRESFSRALLAKTRPVFTDVQILKDGSKATGFDFVLDPTLTVDTKDRGFGGQACRLKFSVVAKAKDGRIVSEHSSETDQRYMESGEKAFRIASEAVFNAVLDAVIQDIDAAKKRAAP